MINTRYQHTNFIYPFVMEQRGYKSYVNSLINNPNCNVRLLQKERNIDLYNYFSKNIKEYFFPTLEYKMQKIRAIEEGKDKESIKTVSELPFVIFEYNMEKDYAGKAGVNDGIFFNISRIEVICFNTGICFLNLRTHIDGIEKFTDVLNFNYKFKETNKEKGFNDGIKIQSDIFNDIKDITLLIEGITKKKYIEQNFFIQSYSCIDSEYWNEQKSFDNIENIFYKYIYTIPYDENIEFNKENSQNSYIISNLKYSKCGLTSKTSNLLTSSIETYNYTKLIEEYNNQYFFTYIINLYKKIYLERLFSRIEKNPKKAYDGFSKIKEVILVEPTKNIFGLEYAKGLDKVLGIEEIYIKISIEITKVAEKIAIERSNFVNKGILIALGLSMIINIVNFIIMIKNGVL